MKPKISFVLAAYNEEKSIVECINSCLNQTFENIEVCVTDDGSSDKTWDLLKGFESDRVKIHQFSKNTGKVKAFNQSYKMATGDYIAIIGADDVNFSDRIENQLDFLKTNDLDLTWGGFVHIDEKGEDLPDYETPLKLNPTKKDILQDNFIPGNTVFFSQQLAKNVFPIPETLKFEDWWISFYTIFNCKYRIYNHPVIKYRIHGGSTVGNRNAGYARVRRKNIKRHFAYHDLFEERLKGDSNLLTLNRLVRSYKEICVEEKFFKRLPKFIDSFKYFRFESWKIIFKMVIVTIIGLEGVGVFRK